MLPLYFEGGEKCYLILRSGHKFVRNQLRYVAKLFEGLRVADVSDGMDKAWRRRLYKKLGLPRDDSVK